MKCLKKLKMTCLCCIVPDANTNGIRASLNLDNALSAVFGSI